jgi:Serine-threonine protein kinase 19
MKRSRIGAALGYNQPKSGPAAALQAAEYDPDEAVLAEIAMDPALDIEGYVQIIRNDFVPVVSVKKQRLEYKQETTHRPMVVCPVPVCLFTQLKGMLIKKSGDSATSTFRRQLYELQQRGKLRLCKVPIGEGGIVLVEDIVNYCDSLLDGMEGAKKDNAAAAASSSSSSSSSTGSSSAALAPPSTTAKYGKNDRLAVLAFKHLLEDSKAKLTVSEGDINAAIGKAQRSFSPSLSASVASAAGGTSRAPKGGSTTASPPSSSSSSSGGGLSVAVSREQTDAVVAWLLREGFIARESSVPGGSSSSSPESSSTSSSSGASSSALAALSSAERHYSFAVPASGPLWPYVPLGRNELVQRLKMRTHHEIPLEDLLKAKLSRSPLPIKFHYRDALGCGLVTEIVAAGGIGGSAATSTKRYVRLTNGTITASVT